METIKAEIATVQARVAELGLEMKTLKQNSGSEEAVATCKTNMKAAATELKSLRAQAKKLKPKQKKKEKKIQR